MYQLTLKLKQQDAFRAEGVLESMCLSVTWFEEPGQQTISADVFAEKWQLDALFEKKPDGDAIKKMLKGVGCKWQAFTLEKLPANDWLKQNQESFAPIRAGRFYVHPSDKRDVPKGAHPVLIDAATAFGTGHHSSTYCCLLAADYIFHHTDPKRVLDMGCGTAILAMAAARAKKSRAVAVDIDHESVRVSKINARANRLHSFLDIAQSNGYNGRLVKEKAPYDLVFANILAKPLTRMAKDARKSLRPGGYLILAGLLESQEAMVLSAHRLQGLRFVRRFTREGWHCLLLQA